MHKIPGVSCQNSELSSVYGSLFAFSFDFCFIPISNWMERFSNIDKLTSKLT